MTDTDERAEWVAGARALIDFVESTPELPLPTLGVSIYVWDADPLAPLAALARTLGHVDKDVDELWFKLVRSFGPHRLRVLAYRDLVCQRVVTGTKAVTTQVPPEGVEMLTVTEEVETFEWVCPPSILAAASETAA